MNKTNCGVACIERYLQLTDRYNDQIICELKQEVTEEGLSFQSIIDVMGRHGYSVSGYYSRKMFHEVPYVMFDRKRKHYYLIERIDHFTVNLYDPNSGEVRILRLLFALFWCKYYLTICYNEGR